MGCINNGVCSSLVCPFLVAKGHYITAVMALSLSLSLSISLTLSLYLSLYIYLYDFMSIKRYKKK